MLCHAFRNTSRGRDSRRRAACPETATWSGRGGRRAREPETSSNVQQGRKRHERRELLHLGLSVLGEELLQAEPDFTFLLAHTVPLQLV